MEIRFRALRLLALLCRILAWVVLALGIVLAGFMVVVGAIQENMPEPSPLLAALPLLGLNQGLVSGILMALVCAVVILVKFLLLQALGDMIYLSLAVEESVREVAFYLRGESDLPPPPLPALWTNSLEPPAASS